MNRTPADDYAALCDAIYDIRPAPPLPQLNSGKRLRRLHKWQAEYVTKGTKPMHVTINTSALTDEVVSIREDAAADVRMSFNPSAIKRVDRLKALAAAFISECRDANTAVPEGAREFAIAITNMQTAQMWSVLAATAAIAAKR